VRLSGLQVAALRSVWGGVAGAAVAAAVAAMAVVVICLQA